MTVASLIFSVVSLLELGVPVSKGVSKSIYVDTSSVHLELQKPNQANLDVQQIDRDSISKAQKKAKKQQIEVLSLAVSLDNLSSHLTSKKSFKNGLEIGIQAGARSKLNLSKIKDLPEAFFDFRHQDHSLILGLWQAEPFSTVHQNKVFQHIAIACNDLFVVKKVAKINKQGVPKEQSIVHQGSFCSHISKSFLHYANSGYAQRNPVYETQFLDLGFNHLIADSRSLSLDSSQRRNASFSLAGLLGGTEKDFATIEKEGRVFDFYKNLHMSLGIVYNENNKELEMQSLDLIDILFLFQNNHHHVFMKQLARPLIEQKSAIKLTKENLHLA